MLQAPEDIQSIQPYIPGKPVKELERELGITGSIKLASNENPIGPSPRAVSVLRKGLTGLHRYPDGSCYYLREALSRRLNIQKDEIIFGNGSNEIIELAVRTFLMPGDEAIMAHPSFVVYSMIVQAAQGRSIFVPLRDWRHDLEAMASRISDRTRLIFIANPNNPTGTINTAGEMASFMEKVPDGVLVIIDEAYYEYVSSPDYADSLSYFRQNRDILVLRTFSKIYGLAGLRIGYGIARSSLVSDMNRVRQPFNVNALAQAAALAALEDSGHVEKTRTINGKGKKYLYTNLRRLKMNFVPTEANFIYLPLEHEAAQELYSRLLRQGIIIRPMGQRALRITVGRPSENRALIHALEKLAV